MRVIELLYGMKVGSKSVVRRKIFQGAVKFNGRTITSIDEALTKLQYGDTVEIGRDKYTYYYSPGDKNR